MPKLPLTRRQLLVATAPIVATVPLIKFGLDNASAQELTPTDQDLDSHDHTHAAHIGAEVPAPASKVISTTSSIRCRPLRTIPGA